MPAFWGSWPCFLARGEAWDCGAGRKGSGAHQGFAENQIRLNCRRLLTLNFRHEPLKPQIPNPKMQGCGALRVCRAFNQAFEA